MLHVFDVVVPLVNHAHKIMLVSTWLYKNKNYH